MPASAKTAPAPARPYGGLAMEERVAARRARFVEAGIELFGTQGFRGATVRGICAAAGLTDRYFYESFASLEALLADGLPLADATASPTRLTQESFASEGWRGDAAAIERQVTAAYELWFDTVRDPRFARILLVEVLGVSPQMDALYEESARAMAALTIAPLAGHAARRSSCRRRGANCWAARWSAPRCRSPRCG